jgi:hypothetical protein
MAGERDRFSEWYDQNRYRIESGLGGFYVLRRQVYVNCNTLHEEYVGNLLMRLESKVSADEYDGLIVNILASLETRRRRYRAILCCDEKILKVGDNFCLPGTNNCFLFKLLATYSYGSGILVGPGYDIPKED